MIVCPMCFRTLLPLTLATAIASFSQSLSLSGNVTDQHSAPIPSVDVTLTGSAGGRRVAATDNTGKYQFTGLSAGTYSLVFEHASFETVRRNGEMKADAEVSVTLSIEGEVISIDVVDVAGKATASRLEIPDSDIPVQVSSIPEELLQQQGINDMVTALRNASGVQAQRFYGVYEYYTIRGFNSSDVMLVDGMRLEGNRFNTQLNNVETIEVLKGPASVLYGNSALGGAINVVRKKPQSTPLYELMFKGGRFNTEQIAGGATGRLWGPRLLYRLDASYDHSDGWRHAGARRTNVSPSLTYLMTEKARVTVHQAFNADNYDGDGGLPIGVTALPGFDLSHRFSTPSDFVHVRDSQTQVLMNYNITPKWELRDGLLIRRTSDEYFVTEGVYFKPGDTEVRREGLYFHHNRRPIQNQADITGQLNFLKMHHTVLLGYEYQDFYTRTAVQNADGGLVEWPPVNLATLQETAPRVTSFPAYRYTYQANQINAFYWQDQIDVSRHLKINVGGRLDDYNRDTHRVLTADPATRRNVTSGHERPYTYRAGIVYSPASGHQFYFNSMTSFTPVTSIPPSGAILPTQHGRNFEVGHRWQSANGRITTSLAAYMLDMKNVAFNTSLTNVGVGQEKSNGIDFDLNVAISPTLRLLGNYGFTQPKFVSFIDPDSNFNYSGLRPRFTQKHAANLWLNKMWKSGFTASIGMRYLGPMFTDNENTTRIGGWTAFSGAAGYRHNKWELTVNAENLFNRARYFTGSDYTNQVYPGAPVNVFATVRFHFN